MQTLNKNIYYIYMLECNNGSYYTGYTIDIGRRLSAHLNNTANAKYTRSFKPVRIANVWELRGTKAEAMKVEAFIKSRDRKFKENLVNNPHVLKSVVFEKAGLNVEVSQSELLRYAALMQ